MTIELDSTLAQAEVLFLSFSQLIADIDRKAEEARGTRGSGLRNRTAGNPSERVTLGIPTLSGDLRDLLRK